MLTDDAREPLGFLLVDAARLLRARIDRALEAAGLGLTAGEARTLLHADRSPALQQNALAAQMSVEPMTLVGYLDRLEARGFIARERDPRDGRAKIVRVTPGARPLLDRVEALARRVREEATRDLDPDEVETVRSCLARMRRTMVCDAQGAAA